MPYSEIVDGRVLDYSFTKSPRKDDITVYNFYIGDIYIGQIFKGRRTWDVVSGFENKYGVVKGFVSRMDAAEYLLQVYRTVKEE